MVSNFFNRFEQFITSRFPHLVFGEAKKPILELSHDIDAIYKTPQIRFKQAALNGYNSIRSILLPKAFWKNARRTLRILFLNPEYGDFNHWASMDLRHQRRSIFYVYSQAGKKTLRSWIVDPSYIIPTNLSLIDRLKRLAQDGFELGLHGSYLSAINGDRLAEEKTILERAIGRPVKKVRQHWLNYVEKITPHLHEELFESDSTIGFNDSLSYRAGCAASYRPYDHQNDRPFCHRIVPLIIMDSNIFQNSQAREHDTINRALIMIGDLRKYKQAHVSLSWHSHVHAADFRWQGTYEQILARIPQDYRDSARL